MRVSLQATLCSRRGCMEAIVAQLGSDSEELHQVGAAGMDGCGDGAHYGDGAMPTHPPRALLTQVVSSILRNLSWRADINSKKVLREVGSVAGLTQCALHAAKVRTRAGGGGSEARPGLTPHPHTGVHTEERPERALEPVGTQHGEQSRHLRRGGGPGLPGEHPHLQVPEQLAGHHRERRRHPAQRLQPHRHTGGLQVGAGGHGVGLGRRTVC